MTIRATTLPAGDVVPVLGQGTWNMGEQRARRDDEIAALRLGLDLGMTLIDTAEMYGNGGAEEVVGEAIAGRRDEVYLVSKVLPSHATARGTVAACESSLRRLGVDYLDLYLLHWRGSAALKDTLAGFESLVRDGRIRAWGVSNFDTDDMEELIALPGGAAVTTNQVLYNPSRRGIEWDLLPWCQEHNVPVMAYSPIEQGRILRNGALRRVAERHHCAPAQIALAWVLRQEGVIAIPKARDLQHVRENRESLEIQLTPEDLADLDHAFPSPTGPRPLELL